MTRWLMLAVAGAVTFAIGAVLDPAQAYFSYLTAYVFGLGIVLSALMLVLIEELIAATWFVVFRRAAETIASTLPIFVVLFVPIVLGARWLYPWTRVPLLDVHARDVVVQKTAYLNLPFFMLRAAVYFACWVGIAERVRTLSLRQDREPGSWNERIRALSGPGLIVLSFTLAFAAIDWVMSLSPTWFSTIFGLQLFAGGMLAALGLIAVIAGFADDPALDASVSPDHAAALGKMILTFAIFWAYTSYVQLLIIWIANLPAEVTWYVSRANGAWRWVGLTIAAGEFAVPFALMLSYRLKRHRRMLAKLGLWILAIRYVEIYWMVMPQLHVATVRPHWLDASAAATVVGAAAACAAWRAQGHASIPIGDPELQTSLKYSEA